MHSFILDLVLGFLKIFGVFEIFCEIVGMGVVICSCIAFSLHFNNVSCILDVCLIIGLCVGRFGLGFTNDAF